MLKIVQLSEAVFVSPQIDVDDFDEIVSLGITKIINNRPDHEGENQPESAILKDAADKTGIHYRHIPVTPRSISDEDVRNFSRETSSAEGAILAFCGTGMRATRLWALSQASAYSTNDLVAIASRAGYDIDDLRPALQEREQ